MMALCQVPIFSPTASSPPSLSALYALMQLFSYFNKRKDSEKIFFLYLFELMVPESRPLPATFTFSFLDQDPGLWQDIEVLVIRWSRV